MRNPGSAGAPQLTDAQVARLPLEGAEGPRPPSDQVDLPAHAREVAVDHCARQRLRL